MSKRLLGPLLLLASLALSLVAAEGMLRLLSRDWLRILDVEMWRYARFVKKASAYPDVVEEHRPNAGAFLMGGRIRTDGRGFRLPDPGTVARRRPGNRQVVALGDSLTLGWGVPEGKTYADQLERRLNIECPRLGGRAVTVWNAGIGNCNTSMEAARYRRFLRPLHPDWLILGYFVNDAEPDPVIPKDPLFWHSALFSLASTRFLESAEVKLRDYRLYYHGLYDDGQPGWARAQKALRELGAELAADHVPATLILLPELHEPRGFGTFADVYGKVAAIGRESGFEVIDPSGDFPAGAGNGFWVTPEDAHPNARAQAIFAQALSRSRYACAR